MNVYDTLKELHISLPPVAAPAAAYVPFVQTGNLVFISGHIAKKDGKPWVGHLVTNGASELLGQVFGERGAHARSAFGVAQIPLGACVEIEMIAEIGDTA